MAALFADETMIILASLGVGAIVVVVVVITVGVVAVSRKKKRNSGCVPIRVFSSRRQN